MSYLNTDTILNRKTVKTTVDTPQDVATSYTDVVGSQITYTPFYAAAKVSYEFTFAMTWKDTGAKATFKLLYSDDGGSSYSDFGDGYIFSLGKSNYSKIDRYLTIKTLLSVWSGERILKLQCKDDSSNTEIYLHENDRFDGSNNAGIELDPIVTCYSIL
ncbi:hypothetical protein CL614_05695 [archaeon]|nr:hypothetical protein [archaeon]